MDQQQFDLEDMRYLRRELLFRMSVQNGVIILNAVAFLVIATLQIHAEIHASIGGVIFVLFSCILAAIWCHHGARQAQIKCYILALQARYHSSRGWEQWLPRNRYRGPLGSRWFISTKAPFIVGAAISCSLGMMIDPSPSAWIYGVAGTSAILAMTGLLLTNPKEGLASGDVAIPSQIQGDAEYRPFQANMDEQQDYAQFQRK